MEKRKDVYKNQGLRKYRDIEFADVVNKKYPIDTQEHIRAARNYFHMPRDYEKYSEKERKIITEKIVKAWKDKISPEGPPEKMYYRNVIS